MSPSCRQYINPFYHGGPYDNASTVSMPAIVSAAASLATALHSIASHNSNPKPPPLQVGFSEGALLAFWLKKNCEDLCLRR